MKWKDKVRHRKKTTSQPGEKEKRKENEKGSKYDIPRRYDDEYGKVCIF